VKIKRELNWPTDANNKPDVSLMSGIIWMVLGEVEIYPNKRS
jgi:hypothetical protein